MVTAAERRAIAVARGLDLSNPSVQRWIAAGG
jgi:hypothetical protein